jgi:hypothetical protein
MIYMSQASRTSVCIRNRASEMIKHIYVNVLLLMSYIFMYHYLDTRKVFQQNLYNSSYS